VAIRAGVSVAASDRVGDWPGNGVDVVGVRVNVRVTAGRRVGEAVVVAVRVCAAVAVTSRRLVMTGVGVSRGTSVAVGSIAVGLGGDGVLVSTTVVGVGVSSNGAASTTVASGVNVAKGSGALLALARGPTRILANPAA
jgi:hypothetical protein